MPDPPDRARERAGGELVLPALELPGAARAAVRGAARLDPAAHPLQRGALVHQAGPERRLPDPRADHLGRARPVGRGARLLRLVRRAPQLLHGFLVRARRRGPHRTLLAGDGARDGEGHPQVPHRVLARAPDGGRHRAAEARLHPRLPADGRAQDVEVARQRRRPVPDRRPLRRRCAALLSPARGHLRPGRLVSPRASSGATRASLRTSTATSRAARSR